MQLHKNTPIYFYKLLMRKYEIDHLRVIAFLILIFYHVGMLFVPWDYHLKNNETSEYFMAPMFFIHQWRLALLFVISGIGTYFSFSRRNTGQFIFERFKRLIIPLIFGMLIIVPPQVYCERLVEGIPYTSYFDYYFTDSMKGSYPNGNFSWHHLWFIRYLFTYSLVLIIIKKGLDYISPFIDKYIEKAKGVPLFVIVCIPTFLCQYFLSPHYPVTLAFWGDWFAILDYLWFFVAGYLFAKNIDNTWPIFNRLKYITLALGIISYAVYSLSFTTTFDNHLIASIARSVNAWCWIFTIIGFAITFLNKSSKWLTYANEAVYPFYILHQTVIIIIAYYIYNSNMSIFTKYIIVASGTVIICWILYQFLIRKYNVLRFLFGMKPLARKTTENKTEQ